MVVIAVIVFIDTQDDGNSGKGNSDGVDDYDVHEAHQQKTGHAMTAFQEAGNGKLVSWKEHNETLSY